MCKFVFIITETKEDYLIYAADQKVMSAYLDPKMKSTPFAPKDNNGSPLDIDFDFENKFIFYSDGLKRAVYKVNTTADRSELIQEYNNVTNTYSKSFTLSFAVRAVVVTRPYPEFYGSNRLILRQM